VSRRRLWLHRPSGSSFFSLPRRREPKKDEDKEEDDDNTQRVGIRDEGMETVASAEEVMVMVMVMKTHKSQRSSSV